LFFQRLIRTLLGKSFGFPVKGIQRDTVGGITRGRFGVHSVDFKGAKLRKHLVRAEISKIWCLMPVWLELKD